LIVLLSGGLDSTVLTANLAPHGNRSHTRADAGPAEALSINYGQRHSRELVAAAAIARHLHIRHDIVDIVGLAPHLRGSALTDPDVDVPEGHYTAPSMAATVVPGRNAIMLAVAVAVAAARGHRYVATAVHAGDHPIYPDCRPEFITAASETARLGTAGHGDVTITAPYLTWSKADIVRHGYAAGAPLGLSWSCYQGGPVHCGRCGTCVERLQAFKEADVPDPTVYADPAFAATVTAP
jgi:7-cyano-7-deazaguanine synthase